MTRKAGARQTYPRVTDLLKKAVSEKGQVVVAKETGLAQSAVSRYCHGIGEPTQAVLERLADYFKKPMWWLRGGNTGALSSTNSLMAESIQVDTTPFQLFWDTLALTAENKSAKEDLQESYENILNVLVSKYNLPENEVKNLIKDFLDDLTKSLRNVTEKELSRTDTETYNSDDSSGK